MAQSERFVIGAVVNCSDGICGRVIRVVVDPVARAVTHLAVEPEHRQGLARLVPIDLATASADGVTLACTIDEFEQLDSAEETQFIPGTRGYEVYGPEQVLSWPYYQLGDTVMSTENMGKVSETITFDTIPLGEVAIRRGDRVHAVDGAIGHVEGLVIDADTDHVSHVLLAEGHLWGRKQVAIPISAVTGVDDEISLSLTKEQVQDLPPVDVSPPDK
jgi:sporulation protein YlmC with PRC-barrel domain